MAYFEWAADLEIDQGPIDADHRKLVAQVNQLHDAGQITVAAQLSALLRDWLSLHIRRSDKAVKHFLDRRAREARRLPRS